MPLPAPNLDDRTFEQLMEEAIRHIHEHCPEWHDFPPGDPGRILLEAFAFMTETMLYRFNRLPEKAYVEFLKLIGTQLKPPSAARVRLVFNRHNKTENRVEIPKGSRITTENDSGPDTPVFVTEETLVFDPGEKEVSGYATHGIWIEAELAGISNGMPSFSVRAAHAPVPLVATAQQDIRIGVEVRENEPDNTATVMTHQGKLYQLWEPVEHFSTAESRRHICVIDRVSGQITFSPTLQLEDEQGLLDPVPHSVAAIPAVGREIRLWYFSGGGIGGNVISNTLSVMKDPVPGISVSNPESASGGRDQESLENALQRGPIELYSLNRAVTAQDFEQIALNSSRQIKRAKAFTSTELWKHATPGSVEVVVVPYIEHQSAADLSYERLQQHLTNDALSPVQNILKQSSPIGIHSKVTWARYKAVSVRADLIAHSYENIETTKTRLLQRLYELISPLPHGRRAGQPFGEALHISSVYDVLLSDPGIRYVDSLKLVTNDAPADPIDGSEEGERESNQINSVEIAADFFQQDTWYTNRGGKLFRSQDNGEGWELIKQFPGEAISGIYPSPDQPGSMVITTEFSSINGTRSRLSFTNDCGESWSENTGKITLQKVRDLSWVMRENLIVLILATDSGLYELERRPGAAPIPLKVGSLSGDQGFYAVSASRQSGGVTFVAAAAQKEEGVYLSREAGTTGSYKSLGLKDKDVRVLYIQQENRSLLWAGLYSHRGQQEQACRRIELPVNERENSDWEDFTKGWAGGSCTSLHYAGKRLYAATYKGGLLVLNTSNPDFTWQSPGINNGLPLKDQLPLQFEKISAVAVSPSGDYKKVMVAIESGNKQEQAVKVDNVFYSNDYGINFSSTSQQVFTNKVTLPVTWLFCSDKHELNIVVKHER